MTKENNRKERFLFIKWGVCGLLCAELFLYIIFFAFNTRIYERNDYKIVGYIILTFYDVFPHMAVGILFYMIGFSFRGKERKSIEINLEELNDAEKATYIMLIRKSMKGGREDNKGIPEHFFPGGEE